MKICYTFRNDSIPFTVVGYLIYYMLLGNSPNVRVVYVKPDSIGLWVYELCVKLINKAALLLDRRLHDAISIIGESTAVSMVVRH